MYDAIKDIWQGRIFPDIQYCVNGDEIMHLHKKNNEAEKSIMSSLPRDKKKLFEELLDDYMSLIDLLREDSFTKGFRLGAQLLKDALS